MKFIREDYIQTQRKRNRTIALVSVIAILVVLISFGVFKKPGGEESADTKSSPEKVTSRTVPRQKIKDLPALIEKTRKSIALIKTFNNTGDLIGQGSGFFVNKDGHVVSNRHVFRGAHRAEVESSRGKHAVTRVIAQNSDYDLVRLAVNIGNQPIAPIKINEKLPKVGESVVVIGNPLGLEATVTNGIVSAIREIEPFGQVIQITCPISSGSSGSPLINMKGEVIGVATFQMLQGQNLNFAIPIARLKNLETVESETLASINFQDSELIKSMENPFDKGLILFNRKEYEGAIAFFQKATAKDPLNAEAHYYLGICYKETRNTNAIEAFKAAINIDPNYSQAYCQLGITYNQLNMQTEAIAALREALRINPNYDEALLNLGIAYHLNKKYQLAVKALEQSLEIYPNAKAYYFLGLSCAKLTKFGKAIQALKQCIEIDPEYIEGYLALATAYGAEQDWIRGIKVLNKAVVIKPDNPEVHFILGILHLGNHDLESAQLEYEILQEQKAPDDLRNKLNKAIQEYKRSRRRRY
ncbi:MAG: tetratricopeptide repeat protein [Candidatus Aminicenantes bacterium]|nr:tetratricopeptide repeat protein [Candidatus Aminicenantes bacterium]NIM81366.1 tetratricopeptide repeat protein [Candidatus Aminicenantes bacterium]NIN20777.1 tetratricopeptide repeat protein [Candidatus Aminicenantes bacterium]NIN44555.1 tetratricopeptide repeat protein [Candidatus Aminicenantes bacterium]NIN87375.1 tetratricopeptide repeat protein [Candidatus Aminicenantes bacterium]